MRVVGVGEGGPEPLVGVARVVGREVAQDPPAARVDRRTEPGVRLVATEQWGYTDAREAPRGGMTGEEIGQWTAAIDEAR